MVLCKFHIHRLIPGKTPFYQVGFRLSDTGSLPIQIASGFFLLLCSPILLVNFPQSFVIIGCSVVCSKSFHWFSLNFVGVTCYEFLSFESVGQASQAETLPILEFSRTLSQILFTFRLGYLIWFFFQSCRFIFSIVLTYQVAVQCQSSLVFLHLNLLFLCL